MNFICDKITTIKLNMHFLKIFRCTTCNLLYRRLKLIHATITPEKKKKKVQFELSYMWSYIFPEPKKIKQLSTTIQFFQFCWKFFFNISTLVGGVALMSKLQMSTFNMTLFKGCIASKTFMVPSEIDLYNWSLQLKHKGLRPQKTINLEALFNPMTWTL